MELQVTRTRDVLRDAELRRQFRDILAASYAAPGELLVRASERSDTAYFFRNEEGEVVAFYLADWSVADRDAEEPLVHMGLSGTRPDHRRRGLRGRLLGRFVEDARAWEEDTGRRIMLWGFTSSPATLVTVHKHFAAATPRFDGSYPDGVMPFVDEVRSTLGFEPAEDGDHPFVVRGGPSGNGYLRNEEAAVQSGYDERVPLFRELGISMESGDRFLILLCRVP